MRILFFCDNFPPEVNAPATRTYEHCREWVKNGDEVTVITCHPNYPQGKVYEGYKNSWKKTETIDGIHVVRIWSYIAANKGVAKRILDQLSYAFMAFWFGLFRKSDVIVATSPQFFITITGYLLSVIKRKPWVFELRDLWPDTIVAVGAIKNKRVLRFLEWLELFLYRKANMVIPVTDAFKVNLISRGIDAEKIKVVTNGTNLELFAPRQSNIELRQQLGIDDKTVVGYLGTHGMTHGLDIILQAAQNIDPSIHFLFVGSGAEKSKLIKMKEAFGISNVSFHDPVPKEDVPKFISIMDIALVPLRKRDTFKTVIPSKIFELASMRKPILLGVEGQAQQIIEQYGAGVCFTPEDILDFRHKLELLANDKELYASCQSGCMELAQDYDRVRLARNMSSHLLTLVSSSR